MKTFASLCLIVLLPIALPPARQKAPPATMQVQVCREAKLGGRINGGESYAHELGAGLRMRLSALGDNAGWTIKVTPLDSDADYAYPLNPPLRSANAQYLGTGYSATAKEQLSYEHVVYFVLNQSDYDDVTKLVQDVLWPYSAIDPDNANGRYLTALAKLPSGRLSVTPLKYETENEGKSVKWMQFSAAVVVPSSFHFAADLSTKEVSCPTAPVR